MKKYPLTALDIKAIMFAIGLEFIKKGGITMEDSNIVIEPMALITRRMIDHLDGTHPLDDKVINLYKLKTEVFE